MAQKKVILVEGTQSTQVTVDHSAKGSLTWRDAAKGGVMATLSAGLATLQQVMEHGLVFNSQTLHTIGYAAGGGLVAYLLKNLFTDTKIVKVEEK